MIFDLLTLRSYSSLTESSSPVERKVKTFQKFIQLVEKTRDVLSALEKK